MTETAFHPPGDRAWLALASEPVLEPALPIVDAHHHLFARPGWHYDVADFEADLRDGHRIVATVYLQCGEHYRADGPPALRPVGETEALERIAERAASGPVGATRIAAGIVAFADLTLGSGVDEVLLAHRAASPTRFVGVRQSASSDPDPAFVRQGARPPPELLRQADFRAGFARLAAHGLSFDAWQYHPQLPDLLALARDFPETPIVMNHCGGPAGIGGYAGRRDEVFTQWRSHLRALAACPNVVAKLGGLGMRFCGFGFGDQAVPPDSAQLAQAWRPYLDTCLQLFGPARCLFESNFPVDQHSCSYRTLWNAFKRVSAGYSPAERSEMFSGTAARVYRIAPAAC